MLNRFIVFMLCFGVATGARFAFGQTEIDKQLIGAVEKGDNANVTKLLQGGADVHSEDDNGQSLLSKAAEHGHGEIVGQLFKARAQAGRYDHDDNSLFPLHYAVEKGHTKIVEQLPHAGAYVEERTIRVAASEKRRHIMKKLLIKSQNVDELTVTLSSIAEKGDEFYVSLLLQAGADPIWGGYYGFSSLRNAVERGHGLIVRLLLRAGADPSTQSNLFLIAAERGFEGIAQQLMGESGN